MGDYHHLKGSTLVDVGQEKAFRAVRGDVITNIRDLANCIEHLSPEQFRHHVHAEGDHNHFADWIDAVLKNPGLAKDLNLPVNREDQAHFVKTIRDHVAWLEGV